MRRFPLCLLIIKIPNKLGDPGIPTIPCSIKNNYVRTALCDLGARVSAMPFSLYKRLYLDKLIPTEISLQMADKSTAIPVGICENVPVQVTTNCPIAPPASTSAFYEINLLC